MQTTSPNCTLHTKQLSGAITTVAPSSEGSLNHKVYLTTLMNYLSYYSHALIFAGCVGGGGGVGLRDWGALRDPGREPGRGRGGRGPAADTSLRVNYHRR